MKIAVIAPMRYPIRQPYAGGLEAFCGMLVDALRHQGHTVDLYATKGSHGHRKDFEFPGVDWSTLPALPTDDTVPNGHDLLDDALFAQLREHLRAEGYDVIHNNSLHPELLRAEELPVVTTLHCPAVPAMAEAMATTTNTLAAVSTSVTTTWTLPTAPAIIPNAVDTRLWAPGPGGGGALWFGRLTPEKAPHLAIDAARRAGAPLTLVGRDAHPEYVATQLAPRAGHDLTWVPPLVHEDLAYLVGHADVVLVTPDWEEPFGLVAIEAMATGTPVVAFHRGGLAEVMAHAPGISVPPGDVEALAAGIRRAASIDRRLVASYARRNYGVERFIRRYEQLYRLAASGDRPGGPSVRVAR